MLALLSAVGDLIGHIIRENGQQGFHTIEHAAFAVELAYLKEVEWFHFGFSGGASSSDIHHYGFFWGVSRRFHDFVPTFGIGLYRNWIKASLNYWEKSASHTDLRGTWRRGSSHGVIPRWDIAYRVGVLYDHDGPWLPYATYSNNRVFLAAPGSSLHAQVDELGIGVLRPLAGGYLLQLEMSGTNTAVKGRHSQGIGNALMRLMKEL